MMRRENISGQAIGIASVASISVVGIIVGALAYFHVINFGNSIFFSSEFPTPDPAYENKVLATFVPTDEPTDISTMLTSLSPRHLTTFLPTSKPTHNPTTHIPTYTPTHKSTNSLTDRRPTNKPTHKSTCAPTDGPTLLPTTDTIQPTVISVQPTETFPLESSPVEAPIQTHRTNYPTFQATLAPTVGQTLSLTATPTTVSPTMALSLSPTTVSATVALSLSPTTVSPTSGSPTTVSPIVAPSLSPTVSSTSSATLKPTHKPIHKPTRKPTVSPTLNPTLIPSLSPTLSPDKSPTLRPTTSPGGYVAPTRSPDYKHRPTRLPTPNPTLSPAYIKTTRKPTVAQTTVVGTSADVTDEVGASEDVIDGNPAASEGSFDHGLFSVVIISIAFIAVLLAYVMRRKVQHHSLRINGQRNYSSTAVIELPYVRVNTVRDAHMAEI